MESLTHAGGIVTRVNAGHREVLLVCSRTDPSHWVFPKGHIEAGESPEQTALREVREEAGVRADLVATVGESEFDMPSERVRVRYFAMQFRAPCQASEARERRWLGHEEALSTLSFENDRDLLRSLGAWLG